VDSTAIIVAVITAVGGVVASILHLFRRENREDHQMVTEQIRLVHRSVNRLSDKIDAHLIWHSEGQHGETSRRNKERTAENQRSPESNKRTISEPVI
jgi:hypothetical protein